MTALFDVNRLNASAAVFDREKLLWMNSQYMSKLTLDDIREPLQPFLAAAGLLDQDPVRLEAALELHRSRARTLKELAEQVIPYFREALDYDPAACAKFLKDPGPPGLLEALRERWAGLASFTKDALEAELRSLCEAKGVKAGVLIHPARMALSATAGGPPLFDLVEVMGRETALAHMDHFIAFLRSTVDGPGPEA